MLGLVLLGLGVALAALMLSYTPDDPNWMAATDTAPQNLLGRAGASVAALLMMIVGYGALVLPIASLVWGVRFLLHAGADRALPRVFFLPIVLALASIYAASHVPPQEWTHSFGLGGLFGDTVLGAVLNALPISAQAGLKLVAAGAFLGGAAMLFHVAGVSAAEFRAAMRFLIYGLLASSAMVAAGLRGVGAGAGHAAGRVQAARIARREARATADVTPVQAGDEAGVVPHLAAEADDMTPVQFRRPQGFFGRLALRARAEDDDYLEADGLEPELPPRAHVLLDDDIEAPRRRTGPRADQQLPSAAACAVPTPSPPPRSAVWPRATRGPWTVCTCPPALRAEPPLTAGHAEAEETWAGNIFAEDGVPGALDEDDGLYAPTAMSAAPANEVFKRRVVQHAVRKQATPSRRAMADAQPSLPLQADAEAYEFPPLTLLTNPDTIERHHLSDSALEENARMLESVLDDYGVKGDIVSVRPGPVVTMYELEPAPGLKASRVIGLADDIARSMSALSARRVHRAGPVGHRHRTAQPAPREGRPARDPQPPRFWRRKRTVCRWRWARISAASPSSRTSPRCPTS